jgi:hypothetical protein
MLRPLGLEKGNPFKPDARQTQILTEAALVGESPVYVKDQLGRPSIFTVIGCREPIVRQ